MAEYTPGPWDIVDSDIIVGPKRNVVAECKGYSVKAKDPAQRAQGGREANARLIAAAPALADALAELVRWMDLCGLSHTKAGGVGPLMYDACEYSVVTDARAALRAAGLEDRS